MVESVFTWPGVGRYTVLAVEARDMPVVTGFAMIAIGLFVAASLIVDGFTALVDPRLRKPRRTRRLQGVPRASSPRLAFVLRPLATRPVGVAPCLAGLGIAARASRW